MGISNDKQGAGILKSFVAPQQVGQGSFNDQFLSDAGSVDFLHHVGIHHPAEPQLIEKNDLFLLHLGLQPPLPCFPLFEVRIITGERFCTSAAAFHCSDVPPLYRHKGACALGLFARRQRDQGNYKLCFQALF
jgi:hypothetical protein